MDVDYVGNPLLDAISNFKPDVDFLTKNNLQQKGIIALLPGSRKQEISYLLPDMLQVADQFPDYQFVIAGAPSFNADFYRQFIANRNVPVLFGATYDLLGNAYAAIVASGTATLETALFNVPQVVVYKGNPVSVGIARMVIKIQHISLVNLIMNSAVVKELIQQDCTPEKITAELNMILYNKPYRGQMLKNYDELDVRMGKPGASAKTAELIIKYSTKK
jgi:lipid-A-disaccharide synthase